MAAAKRGEALDPEAGKGYRESISDYKEELTCQQLSFVCAFNDDPLHQRCDVPQEISDAEIDRELGLLSEEEQRKGSDGCGMLGGFPLRRHRSTLLALAAHHPQLRAR